jgi:hypothetical protein
MGWIDGFAGELEQIRKKVMRWQTQSGQLVDRVWRWGIIPSRSVAKPGGFYAG